MSGPERAQLTPPPLSSPAQANTQRPPASEVDGNTEDVDNLSDLGPAQGTRGNMSSFLLMTIMLFMLANNGGEDLVVRNQYRESLHSLRLQQSNFSTWLWSGGNSAAVNESLKLNFTLPETDESGVALAHAAMGFGVPLNPSYASYFSNMTGFMQGPVNIFNLTTNGSETAATLASANSFASPDHNAHYLNDSVAPPWSTFGANFVRDINMTSALENIGIWDWLAESTLTIRVIEKLPRLSERWKGSKDVQHMNESTWAGISLMHGRIEIVIKQAEEEADFDLEAVHFLENGTIYGLAEPAGLRHVDVRNLPSLVPGNLRNATAQAVNAELLSRIDKLQDTIDSGDIEIDASSQVDNPKTTCSFLVFGQLVPTGVSKEHLEELESEMDDPQGISTISRPEMKMNAILMSKNCGIMIEMHDGEGMKAPHFWRKVTTYAGIASIVYFVLLLLFVRQADISRTPSGISRVSRWAFLAQGAADSISFVGHLTFAVLADGRSSISLVVPAFLAAVLLVYEATFSVLIQQIQEPEESIPVVTPSPPTQEAERGSEQSTSATTEAGLSQAQSSPSIVTRLSLFGLPAGSNLWRRIQNNPRVQFALTVFLSLCILIRVLLSPSVALDAVALIYSNVWFPQIIRSIRRGTTSGLRAEYLIGTSICRIYFAAYMFACPKNVLELETSPRINVLAGIMFLQAGIIMLQNWLGPTFFLPRTYTPATTYDYHPYIPLPDDEAPEPSLGDCAICMEPILVQQGTLSRRRSVSERSESGSLSRSRSGSTKEREREKERERGAIGLMDRIEALATRRSGAAPGSHGPRVRRSYALAPCHHLFHTACLDKWLAIKNICPQCRRPLPPL